ncbi:hypothetical protein HNQ02_003862 [Flavobacterium sp. 7E]|uniref:hypothetical protein n=1 Tax=Flavobacterium sp. 7E TaxID=2735898 RepID=UPI00156E96BD|nr:hypothetical protein [Flavobacterium sp. 7E]NRS90911.1 hypothetical protein [Flavobacterium sp. 7E]
MAKYVVNSSLSFARNFILAEKSRLRSSPLLQAATRCTQYEQNDNYYWNNHLSDVDFEQRSE